MKQVKKWVILMLSAMMTVGLTAQQSSDSSQIKIKKQFTITFEEQVKIRKSKRVPRLKIVHIRPERNPILYDKISFVNSLNIPKKQNFKDVFPYPVFWGKLLGGSKGFLNASAGVQINGKNVIPSLFWNWKQLDAENSTTTRSDILFSGGLRFPLSTHMGFNLNLYHRQLKHEDNDFLKLNNLDSVVSFNKNTLTRINITHSSRFQQLSIFSSLIYEDYKQDYLNSFHFTHSNMVLDARYKPGRLFLGVVSSLTFDRNEIHQGETEYTTARARFSAGYASPQTTIEAGAEFFLDDQILDNRHTSRVIPYARLDQQLIPGILSADLSYSGKFIQVHPEDLLEVNPYAVFSELHPDVASGNFEALLLYTPTQQITVRTGLMYRAYDILNLWQSDTLTGFYHYEVKDVKDDKITRFYFSGSVNLEPITVVVGMNMTRFSLGNSLNKLPFMSGSDLFFQGKWSVGKIKARTEIRMIGNRSTDGIQTDLKSVTLVNALGQYKIKKALAVVVSGENLLNKEWHRHPLYREPGLILRAGVKFIW